MNTIHCGESGAELFRAHRIALESCSRPGRVDEAVAYWVHHVEWRADDKILRRYLKGFGAWDDLEIATTTTLRERALWCGASDYMEREAETAFLSAGK